MPDTRGHIRLWHDDVRPLPETYTHWAKTNVEAVRFLETGLVTYISMDHDLGADPSEGIYARGSSEHNGMELVKWLCDTHMDGNDGVIPRNIRIHSWSPAAMNMAEYLRNFFEVQDDIDPANYRIVVEPFNVLRGY